MTNVESQVENELSPLKKARVTVGEPVELRQASWRRNITSVKIVVGQGAPAGRHVGMS